jgi:hypothetical protein
LNPDSAVQLEGNGKAQQSEKNGIHRRGTEYGRGRHTVPLYLFLSASSAPQP